MEMEKKTILSYDLITVQIKYGKKRTHVTS